MDVLSPSGPALKSLFERLLIMVLVSGLLCEIYNLCHPVCSGVLYERQVEAQPCYRFYNPPSVAIRFLMRNWSSPSHPFQTELRTWSETMYNFWIWQSCLNLADTEERHGVYYKPFGRQEPVIIRSPDAMEELSEAPELSQRAVYADVRFTIRRG